MQSEQDLLMSMCHLLKIAPTRRIPHPFIKGQFIAAGQIFPPGDPRSFTPSSITHLKDGARRGGSFNYIRLALGDAQLASVGNNILSAGADILTYEWLVELEQSLGYMGLECGTGNDYWLMHFAGDCIAVRLGSTRTKELGLRNLDRFKFWGSFGIPIRDQRTIIGGRENRGLIDEVSDYVCGFTDTFPPAHPETWDRLLVQSLRPEIDLLRSRPLANPKCAMATRVTFYAGDDGVACISEKNVDSNTLACLGVIRRPIHAFGSPQPYWNDLVFLPPIPWPKRIREVQDHGTCEVDRTTMIAHYKSDIFGSHDAQLPKVNVKVYELGNGSIYPV